ncbi:hypothetical protein E2R68_01720 [Psychromonas sp. RZ22]|uniref:pilus assembly PilX family protein n=1 Tax=Psychromonas algarum TaxID=2555643 RepID=UPI001067F52C|nr:PilX N-terminal domain-containing pilus assembly protein [Psychromonas sp. RZ22]TEW56783.1 hypothetical protein E2R68_01720 [Psychromonas sp. RZ22]
MNFITQKNQDGAALITALLMVLVISILGVAVSQQVVSLRKTSTSNYDHTLSLNHAESALSEADRVIRVNYLAPDALKALSVEMNESPNWWREESNWVGATVVNDVPDGAPAYLIENDGINDLMIGSKGIKRRFYRVTAKAQGKGEAMAFIQTYYATLE